MRVKLGAIALVLTVFALSAGGCKTGAVGSVDAGPFMFKATGAPNGCFIESVRFHDEFYANSRSRDSWMRLLHWGIKEDYTVTPGHAVAVFDWRGKLAIYDINGGVLPIAVDPAVKMDLTEVGPPIFRRYPRFETTGAEYMIDIHRRQLAGLTIPRDFPKAPKYHPLLRAAKALARHRPVQVYRFAYASGGQELESAAVAFVFDGQLCIYVAEKGTMVNRGLLARIDNERIIRARLERAFGEGSNVRLLPSRS
jgi:hypothetical protein